MRFRALLGIGLIAVALMLFTVHETDANSRSLLIHLKTALKQDDAQICVAYNAIWAALEEGLEVNVLVDASAVKTYEIGFFGKDGISSYKLPGNMRETLAGQFKVPLREVPTTYGEYLEMLRQKGAEFYINEEMLITAGIARGPGDLEQISAKFFKPISLGQMVRLRIEADAYMAY